MTVLEIVISIAHGMILGVIISCLLQFFVFAEDRQKRRFFKALLERDPTIDLNQKRYFVSQIKSTVAGTWLVDFWIYIVTGSSAYRIPPWALELGVLVGLWRVVGYLEVTEEEFFSAMQELR